MSPGARLALLLASCAATAWGLAACAEAPDLQPGGWDDGGWLDDYFPASDDGGGDDDDQADDDDLVVTPCAADGDGGEPEPLTFLEVPAGAFAMGCSTNAPDCDDDERPSVTMTLTRAFELGRTEVTQGQWEAAFGNNPSRPPSCGANWPVETVSWYEALAFANHASEQAGLPACFDLSACTGTPGVDLACPGVAVASGGSPLDCAGYRLPTEAEWEYAARAGTDLTFAGAQLADDVAWYLYTAGHRTHRVATKAANGWGFFDLSGNVWEWAWDWYDADAFDAGPQTDPVGPADGVNRNIRGGDWTLVASSCRVINRYGYNPDLRNVGLGFRLARTLP